MQVCGYDIRRSPEAVAHDGVCGRGSVVLRTFLFAGMAGYASLLPAAPVLLVADSTRDLVLRLEDRDGSGAVEAEASGEVVVYYDDASPGPDLSVASHLAMGDDGRAYLLDGGTVDAVLCLRDLSGDLDAGDEGEVSVFYDNSNPELPEIFTANTLVRSSDGAFYLSDDGSAARRILRLFDLSGDGDVSDAGESRVVYDGAAQDSPFLEDIESLAVLASGDVLAGDSASGSVYRLTDRTGNGDFNDAGEVSLFFRGEGAFALEDVDALAVSGATIYVVSEDTGTVVWLRDLDGDGAALSAGEYGVFLDGSTSPRVADINDLVVAPSGEVFVADGARDTIFLVRDLNRDGDALDAGEVVGYVVGDVGLTTPSAITVQVVDRPLPGSRFVRGDVDGSGRLDLSDVIAGLDHLFLGGEPEACFDARDVNDSGAVDVADPVYALNHLFLGGAPPPPPFPESGVDPTRDALDC